MGLAVDIAGRQGVEQKTGRRAVQFVKDWYSLGFRFARARLLVEEYNASIIPDEKKLKKAAELYGKVYRRLSEEDYRNGKESPETKKVVEELSDVLNELKGLEAVREIHIS
ncbi:MAG: hypothetical protein AB1468_02515 [Candidatus Micrarchaeota archaeon]